MTPLLPRLAALPAISFPLALLPLYALARGACTADWLLGAGGALLCVPPLRRVGALLGAIACGLRLARTWPVAANHEWLEAVVLLLVALLPSRPGTEGRALLARSLGAIAIVVIFAAGVQKVVHGFYRRGDAFEVAWALAPSKFVPPLDFIASAEDRALMRAFRGQLTRRIQSGEPGIIDADPPSSPAVTLASRLACTGTLLAELILPLALLSRRLRRIAAVELAIFLALVEAFAHEWTFGALTAILLLPFLARAGPFDPEPAPEPPPPSAPPRPAALRRAISGAELSAARVLVAILCSWPFAHAALAPALGITSWKLAGMGMYATPPRWGGVFVEALLPAKEPRGPGGGGLTWTRLRPAGRRAESALYTKGFELRSVPLLGGVAREAAAIVAAHARPEPPRGAPLRVRAIWLAWDAEARRFRVEERVWVGGLVAGSPAEGDAGAGTERGREDGEGAAEGGAASAREGE